MKKIVFLLCFSSITLLQAQEKTTEGETTEEKEEISINVIDETSEDVEVPITVIENVPVYSGCDENMGNQAIKECMSSQISSLISQNFNIKLASSLDLPVGKVKIIVMFKIDKEGNVISIKARAPHPKLEEEAIRIIKLIPKMQKPGIQRGKPVIVPYTLPITFEVKGAKPLTKKEQRKLKKKNKT